MEADFSGYATKAGLVCSDGRTIMPDAFKHQDKARVPLVWQHGHTDPENVLGHAILEHREDGVYAYGFFNKSTKATHGKELLEHGDINMLSIWANQLVERSKRVFHGAIREVSLVLAGANPGARIDSVTIHHSDGEEDTILDDEVIIFTGLEIEIQHADTATAGDKTDETVKDIYDSMTQKQKDVLHFMLAQALDSTSSDKSLKQDDLGADDSKKDDDSSDDSKSDDGSTDDTGDGSSDDNTGSTDTGNKDNEDNTAGHGATDNKEGNKMTHNVFEKDKTSDRTVLSHDDMKGILDEAKKVGSFKEAVEEYALAHNITSIDVLFPEAQSITNVPEFLARRNEWVNRLLSATRKSPFTRIKTISADLTFEDARAKGYVKGALKKEEFFGVTKRVTIPSTIYKKQKLDRDDMIDITDFDVVVWLKGEMRVMLDEELARAVLIGDGRDISHEDKISESNIRPIATDHELYTTKVYVNLDDASSSITEVIDAIITNRSKYRGTGQPVMFTTETIISKFLLLKDSTGRRIYKNLQELADELRVSDIVPVEVMEEEPNIIAILVNPIDYVLGADKGGQVSMFDDFDIDYNQYKYLIETRVSGALVKLKAAVCVLKTTGTNVLVATVMPTFDDTTGALTIPTVTGVVYKHGATTVNAGGSPYTVANGTTWVIDATPAAGYYFASSDDDSWSFTNPA